MMKNLDKMGVLVLMSHLIITLTILAIYGVTIYTGQTDETLKTVLTVVVGYWFGSMGSQAIKRRKAPHEVVKEDVEQDVKQVTKDE